MNERAVKVHFLGWKARFEFDEWVYLDANADRLLPPDADEPFYDWGTTVGHVQDDQYEVDKILKKRKRKDSTFFRLCWRGYSESSDSWEPEENVHPDLIAYKLRIRVVM